MSKYALKKLRRIRANSLETGKSQCTLNDLKTVQITGGQDVVYSEGSEGAKLAAFDVNKVASIKATNGAIETGFLAMQVGTEEKIVTNGHDIQIREVYTVADITKIILNHKANGAEGNELKFIYRADVYGRPSALSEDCFTQNATASATSFAYDPETKEVTLPTNVFKIGDKIVIDYYPTFKKYSEISNDSDKFSLTAEIIVEAWFTEICTKKDVPLMLVMKQGKISGNIDMSFGDQAAIQNIEIEALTDACDDNSQNLWKLYTYDMEDVSDA